MMAATMFGYVGVGHVRGARGRAVRGVAFAATLASTTMLVAPAMAQDLGTAPSTAAPTATPSDTATASGQANEIVVTGALNALPLKNVGSVFGFDKTLVETPRSASTVSSEQLERFGITQIYDLVSQAPGTFTSSFFGTGGALDIRGAPSDVYFRGMLRLDNPGNYSTPIGAADRIDIVRGPASVIYGPSKIGGYMNFVPKTARAANGSYAADPKGFVSFDNGSWGYDVLKGSITGPGKIGDHPFGYSLYAELEHSNSYYDNVFTHDVLLSGAFDTDITSNLRTEFGGMFQRFHGVQNSGWNRLTQDLIDHGTYVTGSGTPLDTSGDGKISREESRAANGGNGVALFGSYSCGVNSPFSNGYNTACFLANPDLNLLNPGTTHISRKQTLTGDDDRLNNTQKTAYFDLIFQGAGNLTIRNQSFFDGGKNLNENAYGFSQAFNSWVAEDKIVIADSFDTALGKLSVQASPDARYTRFNFHDDFGVELWNRPDISVGYTPASTRLLATECDCDYSDYVKGHYLDLGAAALVDADFNFGLDIIGGVRWDHVHVRSTAILEKYDPADIAGNVGPDPDVSGSDHALSWSISATYKTPFGLNPYITASNQSTIVAGEGSEIYPGNITSKAFLGEGKLLEAGVKGEFLNKRLYGAVSWYKQKRTQAGAESSLTNQILQTKGIEAELRWAVDRHLLVTGAFTHMKVINIGALEAGSYFNYFGAGNFPGVNPALIFGGSEFGLVPITTKESARRPGEPENVVSATATYAFSNGIAISGDVSHVDAVYADYTQTIRLPSYWLLNLGLSYTVKHWLFRGVVKNLNNARYFRAGGQDLFGADIALPQRPRSYLATVEYKF